MGDEIEVAKARLGEFEAPARGLRERLAVGDCGRIPIDSDDARATLDEGAGIAAAAERAVDVEPALVGIERGHRLLNQNRDMDELTPGRCGHVGAPAIEGPSRPARRRRTSARASSRWV